MPDHVADGEGYAAAGQLEHVVPVASEAGASRRQIAAGELQPGDRGQLLRQQMALEGLGDPSLLEQLGVLDRDRGPIGGELEQLAVVGGEVARGEAADVQDAEHAAGDEQGDAEQAADALLAQDRVEDVGVVDVLDRDRGPGGGDAAGEAAADRDAHALLDLLLDALGGACAEHLAARLEQEDRGRVDVQDLGDALEQLDQQLVRRQVGERGVRDALECLEHPLVLHAAIIRV